MRLGGLLTPPLRSLAAPAYQAASGIAVATIAMASTFATPVADAINRKVRDGLLQAGGSQEDSVQLENQSHLHAGHAGNPSGAPDAETHFKLSVVSAAFAGKRTIQRHRLVHGFLKEELAGPVHALSLVLKTPDE